MTTGFDAADERVIPTFDFNDRLRKARQTVGMDQRDFAARLNVTAGSLAGWESGRTKPRDVVAIAKRIELLTRVPASWTLGLDTKEAPVQPDGPDGGSAVRHQGLEPRTR